MLRVVKRERSGLIGSAPRLRLLSGQACSRNGWLLFQFSMYLLQVVDFDVQNAQLGITRTFTSHRSNYFSLSESVHLADRGHRPRRIPGTATAPATTTLNYPVCSYMQLFLLF